MCFFSLKRYQANRYFKAREVCLTCVSTLCGLEKQRNNGRKGAASTFFVPVFRVFNRVLFFCAPLFDFNLKQGAKESQKPIYILVFLSFLSPSNLSGKKEEERRRNKKKEERRQKKEGRQLSAAADFLLPGKKAF